MGNKTEIKLNRLICNNYKLIIKKEKMELDPKTRIRKCEECKLISTDCPKFCAYFYLLFCFDECDNCVSCPSSQCKVQIALEECDWKFQKEQKSGRNS